MGDEENGNEEEHMGRMRRNGAKLKAVNESLWESLWLIPELLALEERGYAAGLVRRRLSRHHEATYSRKKGKRIVIHEMKVKVIDAKLGRGTSERPMTKCYKKSAEWR